MKTEIVYKLIKRIKDSLTDEQRKKIEDEQKYRDKVLVYLKKLLDK